MTRRPRTTARHLALAMAASLAMAAGSGAAGAQARPAGGAVDVLRASGATEAEAATALAALQRALLNNDREAVARLVEFPLAVHRPQGSLNVADPAGLLAEFPAYFTPPVRRAVMAATPATLMHSSRGVMVGQGEVWFGAICPTVDCTDSRLRIIALNLGRGVAATAPTMEVPVRPALPAPPAVVAPVAAPAPMPAIVPTEVPAAALPTSPAVAAISAPPTVVPAPVVVAPKTSSSGAAAVDATGFVNRVWRVGRSNAVAEGTLYTFLSEGTLVIASSQGTPGIGRWRFEAGRLTMVEMSRPYPVEIVSLSKSAFSIRVRGPGEAVEIDFVAAAP